MLLQHLLRVRLISRATDSQGKVAVSVREFRKAVGFYSLWARPRLSVILNFFAREQIGAIDIAIAVGSDIDRTDCHS